MGTNAAQVPMMPPSKNKSKMFTDLGKANKTSTKNKYGATEYEKKENRAFCNICIESKIVDGKPVTTFELKHDNLICYGPGMKKQPKNEIYTDPDKFGLVVAEKIKQIVKDLS